MATTRLEKALAAAILVGIPVGLVGFILLGKPSTSSARAGWTNEETVQIKRDDTGFISEMTVHRDVHDR